MMSDALGISAPKYKATKFLSEIGWRLLWIKGILSGVAPTITRETAETANQNYRYSNEKIKTAIGIKFINIKGSIEKNSIFFLRDYNKN